MKVFSQFVRPFKRIYKQLLSYYKPNWTLSDYPIEYRKQKLIDLSGTNLTIYPWEARVINWYWMNGDGFTKKEAYLKLKEKFEEHLSTGHELPRPGTKVQIQFASIDRIDELESEAVHFFKNVFDMDYYGLFISDLSSMYDFCWTDEVLDEKQKIIEEIYGTNIDDIAELKIVDILERIKDGKGIT